MKQCFKCLRELPLDQFYRHAAMADGRLNKCADCTKRDVMAHRQKHLDRIRAYDRERSKLPHRMAQTREVVRAWRARHTDRKRAQNIANRAIRLGTLQRPASCSHCGGANRRLEKHHPDYTEPLAIVWLCKPCHALADKQRRESEMAS